MDYMKEVEEMFGRLPKEAKNDEDIIKFLSAEYETIKKVSDYVIETPMYKENEKRRSEYFWDTKEYTLVNRWMVFLNLILEAPLKLMYNSIVIFHFPLIEKELKKQLESGNE